MVVFQILYVLETSIKENKIEEKSIKACFQLDNAKIDRYFDRKVIKT